MLSMSQMKCMFKLTAALFCVSGALTATEPPLKPSDATVGGHLQDRAVVTLGEPAPDEGVSITLRSSDPGKLLLSTAPEKAGAESIVVRARQGYGESPEFWLQALESSGTVTYTAEAPGYTKGSGTVTLTPSSIVIVGPLKAPKFITTTHAGSTRMTVYAARLDGSLEHPQEQFVSGGSPVQVKLISSKPAVGHVEESSFVMPAGRSSVPLHFRPAGEGDTVLSLDLPPVFSTPREYASVIASVRKPGLAISDQLVIGENLEIGGVLSLGELAPPEGVTVTLSSDNPDALLLSTSETIKGSKSIEIAIPGGEASGRYFVQALVKEGTVSYTASAPGFRSRTAIVTLAPSGIVLTPAFQGPPDEAQVLRIDAPDGVHRFSVQLSRPAPMHLVAWTAQLDPITHRGADITVQPLRGGLSLDVEIRNANPGVGTVVSQVNIPSGSDHAITEFKPLSTGSTEITVVTPRNFTVPANATTVIGYVRK